MSVVFLGLGSRVVGGIELMSCLAADLWCSALSGCFTLDFKDGPISGACPGCKGPRRRGETGLAFIHASNVEGEAPCVRGWVSGLAGCGEEWG